MNSVLPIRATTTSYSGQLPATTVPPALLSLTPTQAQVVSLPNSLLTSDTSHNLTGGTDIAVSSFSSSSQPNGLTHFNDRMDLHSISTTLDITPLPAASIPPMSPSLNVNISPSIPTTTLPSLMNSTTNSITNPKHTISHLNPTISNSAISNHTIPNLTNGITNHSPSIPNPLPSITTTNPNIVQNPDISNHVDPTIPNLNHSITNTNSSTSPSLNPANILNHSIPSLTSSILSTVFPSPIATPLSTSASTSTLISPLPLSLSSTSIGTATSSSTVAMSNSLLSAPISPLIPNIQCTTHQSTISGTSLATINQLDHLHSSLPSTMLSSTPSSNSSIQTMNTMSPIDSLSQLKARMPLMNHVNTMNTVNTVNSMNGTNLKHSRLPPLSTHYHRPKRQRLSKHDGSYIRLNSGENGNGVMGLKAHMPLHKFQAVQDFSRKINVGDTVECLWRDEEYRLCEVVEKRRLCDSIDSFEYYIHYKDCNRRLDEWVRNPKLRRNTDLDFSNSSNSGRKGRLTRSDRRKIGDDHPKNECLQEQDDAAVVFEKEHEQITKIKNVNRILLGKYEVDAWYYSPYPDEYASERQLFICEYCLKYVKRIRALLRHKNSCQLRHPPGNEIYRKGNISVFEVDGKHNKVYCQNLCLLAKLFLDHKTLYYDVAPFLFYILTEHDVQGYHITGYFSKEKSSPEDFNLACILVLPQAQRRGYGRFLIALSYELSRREMKVGTPEKPLSDLGKLSYRSYWSESILKVLRKLLLSVKSDISIKEIAQITAITTEDIISALQSLGLVQYWKGTHTIQATPKVVEQHLEQFKSRSTRKVLFDPNHLSWRQNMHGGGEEKRRKRS